MSFIFTTLLIIASYAIASIQLTRAFKKRNRRVIKNIVSRLISIKTLLIALECLKCLVLTIVLGIKLNNYALSAFVVHLGHFFPVYYRFHGRDKNFMTFIVTGLFLNTAIGLNMIIAFLLAIRQAKYSNIAIMSTMIVCLIQIIVLLCFGDINIYEAIFFIFFAITGIVRTGRSCITILASHNINAKR